MTDEQMYDPELPEGHEEMIQEAMKSVRVMNLGHSIRTAFTDLNATQLRQWYVETFVLDPFNMVTLRSGKIGLDDLAMMKKYGSWPSAEHAAIGYRLLFELYPDAMTQWPDILDAGSWRNPKQLTQYMLRLMRPWEQIRFDPEGENWYRKVAPHQWQRVGKGAPGQSMAEKWVEQWLDKMNLEGNPLYDGFPPSAEKVNAMGMDQVNACVAGSIAALKKFKNTATADATIRKFLEREPIMWIEPSTLNRIRNMTPFSNGALSLVDSRFKGNDGEAHVISMGELLPMSPEHMVTNANSLKWDDPLGLVTQAVQSSILPDDDYDYREMDELEDDLMMYQCPTYWSFLTHAFPEIEERSAFLRLLGAAMYGTNLKVVAAMIGEPNAGKDTVINWLNYLMPGQVANLPFSAFTPYGDEDRGFAPLMGARVATVSGEVGEGRGSKLLAEKIKTVSSGGGTLRVAEKYEKPTTIWFDGMLFLQGNSVPTIAGGDRALYENRLVAVEFKHPFKLQARSYENLYRSEAGAFAKVLFLNYVKYQHRGGGMTGINPPPSWKAFAKEFANAANPHGFIETCIVMSDDPVSTSQFHAALSAMADKFGSPYPVGPNFWPKRLRALGFPLKGPHSIRRQVGQDRVYAYYLTLDADKSDGAFTQTQWEAVLQDAAVTS